MRLLWFEIEGEGPYRGERVSCAPGLEVFLVSDETAKEELRRGIERAVCGPVEDAASAGRSAVGYELDDGRQIAVRRDGEGGVVVYDLDTGEDITDALAPAEDAGTADALPGLALSGRLLRALAGVDDLCMVDADAGTELAGMRDRLCALVDTGAAGGTAEEALRLLAGHVADIGQGEQAGTPLAAAQDRRAELDDARAEARARMHGDSETAERRHQLAETLNEKRAQRAALLEEARAIEIHARKRKLDEAETLQQAIDEATQQCFGLGDVRDFPLDLGPELQRADTRVRTARTQLEQSRAALAASEARAEKADPPPGPTPETSDGAIPEAVEMRYRDAEKACGEAERQCEDTRDLVAAAEARVADAQAAVSALPDFSRMSADPVEYFTQLAASFAIALRTRDEECGLRDRMREDVGKRRREIEPARALFEGVHGLPEAIREYETGTRMRRERLEQRENFLRSLQNAREDLGARMPGLFWLTVVCVLFLGALGAAYHVFQQTAVLYPMALIVVTILYFLSNLGYSRARMARLTRQITVTLKEIRALHEQAENQPDFIEQLMERAQCANIRELEASYERYRQAHADVMQRWNAFQEQEANAAETEERLPRLLERLRETFAQAGETIETEDDVATASANAVTRYQAYREAKRRLTDSRAVLDKHRAECQRLGAELSQRQAERDAAENALRQAMAEAGIDAGDAGTRAWDALSAHREQQEARQQADAQRDALDRERQAAEQRVEADAEDLERHEQALRALLARAHAESVEAWHELADRARQYRHTWDHRTELLDELDAVLAGEHLEALRAAAEADGPALAEPERDIAGVREAIDAVDEEIETLTGESRALRDSVHAQEPTEGSLNEIEEAQAEVSEQVAALENERHATAHAMARIEDAAREVRARVAPKLTTYVRQILAELGDGPEVSITVADDLSVRVDAPSSAAGPSPRIAAARLYLALRCALARSMSENGESLPLLLDEPFADCRDCDWPDLMDLLRRVGDINQVLLLTRREDVLKMR